MAEFVIPDELKQTVAEHGDVGDSDFLIYDSTTGEDANDRIMFALYGMRQRAAISIELYAGGTYRTISNLFWTLHDTRRRRWNSIRSFHSRENEQKPTFTIAFEFTKQFLQSFNEQCVARVDCQMAAIGAFRDVFGCRFVSVSFIKTFCMEGGVEVKTCSSIISMTNKRLHFGIRRLSSLLFLPERDIVEDFLNSSNVKLSTVRSVSRTNSKMVSGTSSILQTILD